MDEQGLPAADCASESICIRCRLEPADPARIACLHRDLYTREFGWNAEFERYVLDPLQEFALRQGSREKIWLVEQGSELLGCIAMVEASAEVSQLRWFLLDPRLRGAGLGRRLVRQALDFAQRSGFRRAILWTVRGLDAAAKLYADAGFRLAEERPGPGWGTLVVEQRYELEFADRLCIDCVAPRDLEPLVDLLRDAVEDGASVGFLLPFDEQLGRRYWEGRMDAPDQYVVLGAWLGDSLVGSVQLAFPHQENGRCRAEVQRLLVLRSARRRGIGRALVERLEEIARLDGRRVLFLNTRTGDPPETMYARLGFVAIGTIPDFALNPDGTLNDTTFMYKRLISP